MKKRVGVLVHPFWYTLETEKSLTNYIEYCKQYDKVIIFLPMLNRHSREYLFNKYYHILINFLLLPKDVLEKMIIHSIEYAMISHCLQDGLYRTHLSKLLDYRKELSRIKKRKISKSELMHELITDRVNILKYLNITHKKITFYGDLSYIPIVNEYTSRLLSSTNNVAVYYFGGVQIIDLMLKRKNCKKLIDDLRDSKVEIFGEYYNVCVNSVKNILKDLGVSSRMIRSKSIYLNNKHKEIDETMYMNIYTPELNYSI